MTVDEIAKADIKVYRSKKLISGLSPKTVTNHVTLLTKLLARLKPPISSPSFHACSE